MVKWIVPSMATVVQKAIDKIRRVTAGARRIAKWYEDHPGRIYLNSDLAHLRNKEWLSMREVVEIMGFTSRMTPRLWCQINALGTVKKGRGNYVRFGDLQKTVIGMLPNGFPVWIRKPALSTARLCWLSGPMSFMFDVACTVA